MGVSKSDEFSVRDNRVAEFAKALSHPARVAIVRLLMGKQSCVCGDIVEELPLSQSTVSQHLKELKNAGIIKGEIDGPRICYCIDPEKWGEMKKIMANFYDEFKDISDKCC